jgi:hypothetical protein
VRNWHDLASPGGGLSTRLAQKAYRSPTNVATFCEDVGSGAKGKAVHAHGDFRFVFELALPLLYPPRLPLDAAVSLELRRELAALEPARSLQLVNIGLEL